MRTTMTAAAILLAAALLTGCSGEGAASPTPTSSNTSPVPSASSESPSPTPTNLALGKPWKWEATAEDGTVTATGSTVALTYRQPITGLEPPLDPDYLWGQIEAKVCNDSGSKKPITVSQFPWSLAFADGTRTAITGQSGGDFPKPEFPMEAVVWPGDCVRGKIMFEVKKGQRPERVIYAPDSIDLPVEWTIPAK